MGAYMGWRYPIYVNSMMLLFVGLPLAIALIEPSRGLSDIIQIADVPREYEHRFRLSDIKIILSNKSNIYVALEEFMSTVPQGVMLAWLMQYVVRELEATETVAMIFVGLGMLGGLLGVFVAYATDRLYQRHPRYRPIIAAASCFAQTVFFMIFLLLPIKLNITARDPVESAVLFLELLRRSTLIQLAVLSFFIGMIFNSSVEPIKNSVVSDVNLPEQRAIVVSSISTIELFFRSVGIAIAGLVSDLTGSLRITLIAFVLLYVVAGKLWLKAAWHYPYDIERTASRLRERIKNSTTPQ